MQESKWLFNYYLSIYLPIYLPIYYQSIYQSIYPPEMTVPHNYMQLLARVTLKNPKHKNLNLLCRFDIVFNTDRY